MVPAREVGGDFFDYFLLDDEHLGFVIGDVSGKGVPAALFMAVSRTLLRRGPLSRRHRRAIGCRICERDAGRTKCLGNVCHAFLRRS